MRNGPETDNRFQMAFVNKRTFYYPFFRIASPLVERASRQFLLRGGINNNIKAL